ncbi:MAG: type 1 glutamine amidotransferase [Bacteroidales bacterium]|nr:type 1 glutamine amidotransferase [Bacteroidales bacterium]
MKILIFKHIHDEPAGHTEEWAQERGHSFSYHFGDQHNVLNSLPEFDLLIIMGGLMGAYEEETYPWLKTEKRLIREAIDSGKKVLGICLGAQLIASALGARVYKNDHAEIGFHHVKPVKDSQSALFASGKEHSFFQWHGDTFELPEGACHIATSSQVKNQAFSYGNNVTALQFHPEMDSQIIEGLLKRSYDSEAASPWKQSVNSIKEQLQLVGNGRSMLFRLLDEMTSTL